MQIERHTLNACPVTVVHLWVEPIDCAMCGKPTFDHFAVPWYCGPVATGESEGGYRSTCRCCHDRWARWDDSLRYFGA
jgi:hypothetical protein